MQINRFAVAGGLVFAAALAVIPLDLPQMNDWLFRIATLVMLAVSWNMMASAGMISLGHSAFWGVGSYGAMLAAGYLKLPFFVSFVPSLLFGALVGLLLALATGRLRGVFFAIATLALSEGLRVVGLMVPELTGGDAGLFLPNELRPPASVLYFTAVGAGLLAVLTAWGVSRTRTRFAMRAMRDNEDAAQMLGINPLLYRALVSTVAGAMAAGAGALGLWHSAYIAPGIAFSLNFAILAQIAAIIGGVHTLAGPVIGAFAIIGLSEVSRMALGSNQGYSLLIYGILLVAAVTFMPKGLYDVVTRRGRSSPPPPLPSPTVLGVEPRRPPEKASNDAPILLRLEGVDAGYGDSRVLEGLSINVGVGEVVCLLGANGVGKTTTLMAVTGVVAPTAGDIRFDGKSLLGVPPHRRVELGIALAPEGRQVFPHCSVLENLLLGSSSKRALASRSAKLDEVYALFPRLAERRKQMAGLMSGGEQQMLAIGRALMSDPRLLMLDEPSLGLAPKVALQVYEVIARIANSGISILLVEQNTQTALSIAGRGYVLAHGHVALSGSHAELRDSAAIREAFFGTQRGVGDDGGVRSTRVEVSP